MTNQERGAIRSVPTGVPGLDAVLGDGLPEYSFNVISGGPGAGKTTLAQQIVFANATAARPAVYFTVLGEPTLKMLRYQRQYRFFDPALVGSAVRYVNLSDEALRADLGAVLDRIVGEVTRLTPGIVVVDSFRIVGGRSRDGGAVAGLPLEHFIQRLALHLTTWEVTSFLIGDYLEEEQHNPVFTVADGVLWLSQAADRNSVVRKIQVLKMRGRATMPGLHTVRITERGLQVFPRIPEQQRAREPQSMERQGTGVPGLDEIMGGGIPTGDAVILAGPAGSGKTTFATQFIAEGLRQGEAGVIAVFEEYPEEYLARTRGRQVDLEAMIEAGKTQLIYIRPLDLSVDETLAEILEAVRRLGARRVVIDSLSGLEVALAPTFRDDFRESLYRLVGALTAAGVTVFMTSEEVERPGTARFTSDKLSFITDDIILQRHVEMEGELRNVLIIAKMRGSQHSRAFWSYDITATGAVIGGPVRNYRGILTGNPEREERPEGSSHAGLTDREARVLDVLITTRDASLEGISSASGLPPTEVAEGLARLVALDYATTVTVGGATIYRALARRGP